MITELGDGLVGGNRVGVAGTCSICAPYLESQRLDTTLEQKTSASYSVITQYYLQRLRNGVSCVSGIGIDPPRNRNRDAWDNSRRVAARAAGKVEFAADSRASRAYLYRDHQGFAANYGGRRASARKTRSRAAHE